MKTKVLPREPWRRAACLFSVAAFSTFAVNLAFTLWATRRRRGETAEDGIGVVFEGGCSEIKRLNTAVHVVVNILGTVLLAGSNYCMQCAIAPARSEIDRAHAKRKWLDVGVPSIRNLGWIRWEKKALWLLSSLSSFPLHLLYNSVIFASISVNSYSVFLVKERFMLEENRALFPNRTKSLGQISYGTPFQSSRGNLLLVTNEPGIIDYDYEQEYTASLRMREDGQSDQPFQWICLNDNEQICEDLIPKIREAPQDWKPYDETSRPERSEMPWRRNSFLETPDNFTEAMSLKPKKPFTENDRRKSWPLDHVHFTISGIGYS
ncbi:hypothetical protein CSHISOI_08477, partial [Colletotrichum shisoi]